MTALFDRLAQASLEGSLLIAGVWLVCRLAPALPASFRVVLWWLATLKLLVGLAGIDPIPLPILPPAALPPNIQSLLVADGRAKARPYEDLLVSGCWLQAAKILLDRRERRLLQGQTCGA